MGTYLPFAALVVAALVGAVTTGLQAAAVDVSTSRRVGLGMLAAALAVAALLVALCAYAFWQLSTGLTF